MVGIGTRTCSVCGALVGVVVLIGSGIAVLVGGGVPVNSGVAVTTTTTGSGSMQATTSIAINAATVIHSLFGTAPPILGFVQFDGSSTGVPPRTSSEIGHPICVRISKTCFSTRTFRFPSHQIYRVSSPSFNRTSPVGVARNTL